MRIAVTIVCLAVMVVGVSLFARAIAQIVRTVKMGQPAARTDQPIARTVTLVREFLGHTRMARLPVVAIAHWFTMVSFGLLFLSLVTAYGQLFDSSFAIPLLGHFPPYEWLVEVITLLGLLGIVYLIAIRQKQHPRRKGRRSRFYGSTFWQAYYVELTILGVLLCILALRGLEYALASAEGDATATAVHYPLTAWLGGFMSGASVGALETGILLVAGVKILISFAWMITISLQPTMGVAWHRFTAFFNIWFKRHPQGRTSLGELQPMMVEGEPIDFENIDELDEDAPLGVGKVEDFTWKGLLDFSTCTECGRCQDQCPAWNTEKPLSPKLLIMGLRDHAAAKSPWLLASEDARADLPAGTPSRPSAPWSVRPGTAGPARRLRPARRGRGDRRRRALVVHHLRRLRRAVPGRHRARRPHRRHAPLPGADRVGVPDRAARAVQEPGEELQPVGHVAARAGSTGPKDLPFEVKQVGADVEDLAEVDYLFWVGCAGAFEDRQKKTTRAVAELLHTAGVEFAVLGDGESCTGDPARRSGNEFLFQMLAQANVEVLNELNATKIVVSCAHCFNTLSNEYPQLGGNYEVVHHTQLLNRLVREQGCVPIAPADATAVAGDLPRPVLPRPAQRDLHPAAGADRRAARRGVPRDGALQERSFCCGAGGAADVDGGEDRHPHQREPDRRGGRDRRRHDRRRLPVLPGDALRRPHRRTVRRRGARGGPGPGRRPDAARGGPSRREPRGRGGGRRARRGREGGGDARPRPGRAGAGDRRGGGRQGARAAAHRGRTGGARAIGRDRREALRRLRERVRPPDPGPEGAASDGKPGPTS